MTRIAYLTFAVLGLMGFGVVAGNPTSSAFLILSQLTALGLGVWVISSMRDFGLAFRKATAPYAESSPKEGSVIAVTGSSRWTAHAARPPHREPPEAH